MNIPNREHAETRARECFEGLQKLAQNEAALGLMVTLGKPLECGCCYETQPGVMLQGNINKEELTSKQLRSLIIAAFGSIVMASRRFYDITDDDFRHLFDTAIFNENFSHNEIDLDDLPPTEDPS